LIWNATASPQRISTNSESSPHAHDKTQSPSESGQLAKVYSQKAEASVDAFFNEVKPPASPMLIYAQYCCNCQHHNYVTHTKAGIETVHVYEATISIIGIIRHSR
jgi:phage gp36-like protein